jgi:hypothetical protein
MVGASGFEPPTSWSRTNHAIPVTLFFRVAYGTRGIISPLLVVPDLYLTSGLDSGFQAKIGHTLQLLARPRKVCPFGVSQFKGSFHFPRN